MQRALRTVHWLTALTLLTATSSNASQPNGPRLSPLHDTRPLAFEENRGQTDPRVKYLSRGRSYTLFLTPAEAVLALRGAGGDSSGSVLRLRWVGGSATPRMTADGQLPGVTSYLTGKDPSRWQTGVPSWTRVHYLEVWPGIDLVFYGNPRQLEYDVVLAPDADPDRVRLAFEGPNELRLEETGDLVARVGGEEVRLRRPVSYQEVDGGRREVESGWRLVPGAGGRLEAGFRVAAYDRSRPLIIDPVLAYSTYLGGDGDDSSYAMAVDAAGNLYTTGETNSTDFPVQSAVQSALAGSYDAYVTKLDRNGRLVYSTYLGGSDGEQGTAIAVDAAGKAYVVGYSFSADFPRVGGLPPELSGGRSDAFVVKLDSGGSFVYSTLLGGSDSDRADAVAVDARGRAHVGGGTDSADFPVRGTSPGTPLPTARDDGFVARLSPSGTDLELSVFPGGSGSDPVRSLDLDAAGHILLGGLTTSRDFPLVDPLIGTFLAGRSTTGFVAKLEPSGTAFVYSTYFAGSQLDADAAGNAYVIGLPDGFSAPDVCASKLDPAGGLLFSTCFGGSSADAATAIAADRAGNIILAGATSSLDFPLKDPIQSECAPLEAPGQCFPDLFVTKLDARGEEILFSTYLGGTEPVAGYPPDELAEAVGTDAAGDIYLAGWTYSADFPTVNAVQPTHGGGTEGNEIDSFALRIDLGNLPPDCSAAAASPSLLWPPNGKLRPVALRGVIDPDGDPVTLRVTAITQDEPLSRKGQPDATGLGTATPLLRASRAGKGDGRVYHLTFAATDPAGAACTGTVTVCVPHDQGRRSCGDGGPWPGVHAGR